MSITRLYVLYVYVYVLILGFHAAAAAANHTHGSAQLAAPTVAVSAGSAAVLNAAGTGVTTPSVSVAGYTNSHHQQQAAVAAALGGGHLAMQTASAHHAINPSIDATLSQAYSGIAQYTGRLTQLLSN